MRGLWLLNIALSILVLWGVLSRVQSDKTYVLTPFLDVVPAGDEWTVDELDRLQQHLPNMLEARDMAKGYAHLGSTLSIDDVLQGIDGLEKSPSPLTTLQKTKVKELVTQFRSEHQKMRSVQRELLQIESRMQEGLYRLERTQ